MKAVRRFFLREFQLLFTELENHQCILATLMDKILNNYEEKNVNFTEKTLWNIPPSPSGKK